MDTQATRKKIKHKIFEFICTDTSMLSFFSEFKQRYPTNNLSLLIKLPDDLFRYLYFSSSHTLIVSRPNFQINLKFNMQNWVTRRSRFQGRLIWFRRYLDFYQKMETPFFIQRNIKQGSKIWKIINNLKHSIKHSPSNITVFISNDFQ